eukprot:PhM_4_TR8242/c0_g1_i1/m.102165
MSNTRPPLKPTQPPRQRRTTARTSRSSAVLTPHPPPHHPPNSGGYLQLVSDWTNERQANEFQRTIELMRMRKDPPAPEFVQLPAAFYESTERAHRRWNQSVSPLSQQQQQQQKGGELNINEAEGGAERPVVGLLPPDVEIVATRGRYKGPVVPTRDVRRVLRSHLQNSENRLKGCKFGGLTEVSEKSFQLLPSVERRRLTQKQFDGDTDNDDNFERHPILDSSFDGPPSVLPEIHAATPRDNVFRLTNPDALDLTMVNIVPAAIDIRKMATELAKETLEGNPALRQEAREAEMLNIQSGGGPSGGGGSRDFVDVICELADRTNEIHHNSIAEFELSQGKRHDAFLVKEEALDALIMDPDGLGGSGRGSDTTDQAIIRSVRNHMMTLEHKKALKERAVRFEKFFNLMERTVSRTQCQHSIEAVGALAVLARESGYLLTPAIFTSYVTKKIPSVAFLLFTVQTTLRQLAPVFGVQHVKCEQMLRDRVCHFDRRPIDFLGDGRKEGRLRVKILMCRGTLVKEASSGPPRKFTVMMRHEHVEHTTHARARACWGEEFVLPFMTPCEPVEIRLLDSGAVIAVARVALEVLHAKGRTMKITLTMAPTGSDPGKAELVLMVEPAADPYVTALE